MHLLFAHKKKFDHKNKNNQACTQWFRAVEWTQLINHSNLVTASLRTSFGEGDDYPSLIDSISEQIRPLM